MSDEIWPYASDSGPSWFQNRRAGNSSVERGARRRFHIPVSVLSSNTKHADLLQNSSLLNTLTMLPDQQESREVPSDESKFVFLSKFDTLIRSLITHASPELRKIKQRQEDLVLASLRADRTRSTTGPQRVSRPLWGQNHHEYHATTSPFFIHSWASSMPWYLLNRPCSSGVLLLAPLTYRQTIESTAGRLPAFLQWLVWSTSATDLTMMIALYDMLSGLSTAQHCNELIHNFMARGGGEAIPGSMLPPSSTAGSSISWSLIFIILDSWAVSASAFCNQPHPQTLGTLSDFHRRTAASQQLTIGPKEVLLAQAFLRLLAAVVTYSVTAHHNLWACLLPRHPDARASDSTERPS